MNNYSNKLEALKRQYEEIFIILENFVKYHQDRKTNESKTPFMNNYSKLFVGLYFTLFLCFFIVLYFEDFWKNNLNFLKIISIFVLILIAILAITSILLLFQEITNSQNFPKILLKKTCQKGIQELDFCHQLSQFDRLALEYAENRLKLLIENRKIGEQIINNLIPFFALVVVLYMIYQYIPENLANFTRLRELRELIVLCGTFSGIITIIFKGVTELIDNKTIYQKCLAIVQYAKLLAEQSQPKNITYLPTEKQKDKDIMTSLRQKSVDQPSDFDYNS